MGVAYSVGEVDHLYTFFVQWSPWMHSKARRGWSLLLVDKGDLSMIDSLLKAPPPENWDRVRRNTEQNIKILYVSEGCEEPYVQIITGRKVRRSLSACSSPSGSTSEEEEVEDTLPVLKQESQILIELHIQNLVKHLPSRVQCSAWQLIYSTEIHGTSLRTLYRNTTAIETPVLLLIKDTHNQVFGAFSSDAFRVSNCCYGTGETFLFTFSPEFQMFCWSGENSYFVRGFLDSLQLGGGGGPFGLWLDSSLLHGSTFSCETFHNAPLTAHHDFMVQSLEVWSFV